MFIIPQNEPLISHVQHDTEVTVPDQGQCLQCVCIYFSKAISNDRSYLYTCFEASTDLCLRIYLIAV